MVYTLVVYDIGDDRQRDKARRFLYRIGFTPVNKSAYIGRAGQGERDYIARKLSRYVGPGDVIVLFPLWFEQVRQAIFIIEGEVWSGLRQRGVVVIGPVHPGEDD